LACHQGCGEHCPQLLFRLGSGDIAVAVCGKLLSADNEARSAQLRDKQLALMPLDGF
jgi:hypothetical protein